MRTYSATLLVWVGLLVFFPAPENAPALVIYRFGGEALPPPPEASLQDVDFVQLDWPEVDAAQGGEVFRLDMDDQTIQALEHDPLVNIAPTAESRGGKLILAPLNGEVWDGDTTTVWSASRYLCVEFRGGVGKRCYDDFSDPGTAQINLGGSFLLDRVRIVSGLRDPATMVRTVRIFVASAGNEPYVTSHSHPPYNPHIVEIRNNTEPFLDIPIPPHEKVTFLQVGLGEHDNPWEVHDIEVYARGFVDQSSYISNRIDARVPAAWGQISWSGHTEPGAKLFIHTRSGADDDPTRYWKFVGNEDETEEVTRAQYDKLRLGEKAGSTYDREHWTFWSAPHHFADSAGTAIVSLSPNRFFQFKVDFFPTEDAGGRLDFLELRASMPPVASGLVGEISPFEVEPGKPTQFTYALRPVIGEEDTGFDRFELASSSSRIMGVEAVRLGGAGVEFDVESHREDEVVVTLPKIKREDTAILIEVDFEAIALRYGSTFNARVFSSSRPLEVRQGVHPGNATDAFEGNRVSVVTSVAEQELLKAEAVPPVFTPNGDGVNDLVTLSYDLFEITGSSSVQVEVRDLSGRMVRTIYAGEDPVGHYRKPWDGTDEAGQRVPPGLYLYRVFVDADKEQVEQIGTLHVVY